MQTTFAPQADVVNINAWYVMCDFATKQQKHIMCKKCIEAIILLMRLLYYIIIKEYISDEDRKLLHRVLDLLDDMNQSLKFK